MSDGTIAGQLIIAEHASVSITTALLELTWHVHARRYTANSTVPVTISDGILLCVSRNIFIVKYFFQAYHMHLYPHLFFVSGIEILALLLDQSVKSDGSG